MTGDVFDVFAEPGLAFVAQHLDTVRRPGARLLEIGCGTGAKGRIVGHEMTVVGSDIEPEIIRQGATLGSDPVFVCADNEYLPFRPETFDGVFSFSVLQYSDWRHVINECRRVMRPRGCGAFVENLRDNPFIQVGRLLQVRQRRRLPVSARPRHHLTNRDLGYFASVFSSVQVRRLHITTPLLLIPAIQAHFPTTSSRSCLYRCLGALDEEFLRTPLANAAWIAVILVRT